MPHNCKILNETDIDLSELIDIANQLLPHAQSVMGFGEPVTVSLVSDQENSINPLGKTAYYDPGEMAISLFVDGRHPKDILRSLSHELVHHTQNCNGMFDEIGEMGPGYAQENKHLREMEREAYEMGNMFFRDWEDEYKKKQNWELNEGLKDMAKSAASFITDPNRGLKGYLGRGVAGIGGDKPGFFTRGLKGFTQAADPIGSLPTFSGMEKTKPYFSEEPGNRSGKGPHWDHRPETIDPDISRYASPLDHEAEGESHASRQSRGQTVMDWVDWIFMHEGEEEVKKAFYSVIYDEEIESTTKMSVYKKYSKIVNMRGYDKPSAPEEDSGAPPTEDAPADSEDPPISSEPPPRRRPTASPITPPSPSPGETTPLGRPAGAPPRRVNPREGKSMTLSEAIQKFTRLIEQEQLNYQDHVGSRFQATADNFLENAALGIDPYDIEVTKTGFKVVGVPEGREDYLNREFTPEGTKGYNPMHWNIAMRELNQAIDDEVIQRPTNLPVGAPIESVPALQESLSFSEELEIRASVQSAIKLMESKQAKRINEYKSKNILPEEVEKLTRLAGLKAPRRLLDRGNKLIMEYSWGEFWGDVSSLDNEAWEAVTGDREVMTTLGAAWDEGIDLTHSPFRRAHQSRMAQLTGQGVYDAPPEWTPDWLDDATDIIASAGTAAAIMDLDDEVDNLASSTITMQQSDGTTREVHFPASGEAQWSDPDPNTGKRSLVSVQGMRMGPDEPPEDMGWWDSYWYSNDYTMGEHMATIDKEQELRVKERKRQINAQAGHQSTVEAALGAMDRDQEFLGTYVDTDGTGQVDTFAPSLFTAGQMRHYNIRLFTPDRDEAGVIVYNDQGMPVGRFLTPGTAEYTEEMALRHMTSNEPCPPDEPNCSKSQGYIIRPYELYAGSERMRQTGYREEARVSGRQYYNKQGQLKDPNPDAYWDPSDPYPHGRFFADDIRRYEELGMGTAGEAHWQMWSHWAPPLAMAQAAIEWTLDTSQVPVTVLNFMARKPFNTDEEEDMLAYELLNEQVAWSDWVMERFAPLVIGGVAALPAAAGSQGSLSFLYGGTIGADLAIGALPLGTAAGSQGFGAMISPGEFGDYSVRRGNRYFGDADPDDMYSRMLPWHESQYGYGGTSTGTWENLSMGDIETLDSMLDPNSEASESTRVAAWRAVQQLVDAELVDFNTQLRNFEPLDTSDFPELTQELIRGDFIPLDKLPLQDQELYTSGFCQQVGIQGVRASIDRYGNIMVGTVGNRKICGISERLDHRVEQNADVHFLESGQTLDGNMRDHHSRDRFVREGLTQRRLREELAGLDEKYATVAELELQFGIDNYGSDEALHRMFDSVLEVEGLNEPTEDGTYITHEDMPLSDQSKTIAETIEDLRHGSADVADIPAAEMTAIREAMAGILDGYIEKCTGGEVEMCREIQALTGWSEDLLTTRMQGGGNWQYEARVALWSKVTVPFATRTERDDRLVGMLRHHARTQNILSRDELYQMTDLQILQNEDLLYGLLNPGAETYDSIIASEVEAILNSRVISETTDAELLLHEKRAVMEEVEMAVMTNIMMNMQSEHARDRAMELSNEMSEIDAGHAACVEAASVYTSPLAEGDPDASAMSAAGCQIRLTTSGQAQLQDPDMAVLPIDDAGRKYVYVPYAEDEFLSGQGESLIPYPEGSFEFVYYQWLKETNYGAEHALEKLAVQNYSAQALTGVLSGRPTEIMTVNWGNDGTQAGTYLRHGGPEQAAERRPSARGSMPHAENVPEPAAAGEPGRPSDYTPVFDSEGNILGYREKLTGEEYRGAQIAAYRITQAKMMPAEEQEALRIVGAIMEHGDEATKTSFLAAMRHWDTDGDGVLDVVPSVFELVQYLDNPAVTFTRGDQHHTGDGGNPDVIEGGVWHIDQQYSDGQINIRLPEGGGGRGQPLYGNIIGDHRAAELPHDVEYEYMRRQGSIRRDLLRVLRAGGIMSSDAADAPREWQHPENSQTQEAIRRSREAGEGAQRVRDQTVAFVEWFNDSDWLNAGGEKSTFIVQSYTRGLYQVEQITLDASMTAWVRGNTGLTDVSAWENFLGSTIQDPRLRYDATGDEGLSDIQWVGNLPGERPDRGEVDYGYRHKPGTGTTPKAQRVASIIHHLWDRGSGNATDATRAWALENVPDLVYAYEEAKEMVRHHHRGGKIGYQEPIMGADDPGTEEDESLMYGAGSVMQLDPQGIPMFTRLERSADGNIIADNAAERLVRARRTLLYNKRGGGRTVVVPYIGRAGPEIVPSHANQLGGDITGGAVTARHHSYLPDLAQQQMEIDTGTNNRRTVNDFSFYIHPDPINGPNGTAPLLRAGQYSPSTNTIIITDSRLLDNDMIIGDPASFVATPAFWQSYVQLVGLLNLGGEDATPPAIIYQGQYVDTSQMEQFIAITPYRPDGRAAGDHFDRDEHQDWVGSGGSISLDDARPHPRRSLSDPANSMHGLEVGAEKYLGRGGEPPEGDDECGGGYSYKNETGRCIECPPPFVWDPDRKMCSEPIPLNVSPTIRDLAPRVQNAAERARRRIRPTSWWTKQSDESESEFRERVGVPSGTRPPGVDRARSYDDLHPGLRIGLSGGRDVFREYKENNDTTGFLLKNKLIIEQISKAFSSKNIKLPRKKLEEVIRKQIMSNLKQGVEE